LTIHLESWRKEIINDLSLIKVSSNFSLPAGGNILLKSVKYLEFLKDRGQIYIIWIINSSGINCFILLRGFFKKSAGFWSRHINCAFLSANTKFSLAGRYLVLFDVITDGKFFCIRLIQFLNN